MSDVPPDTAAPGVPVFNPEGQLVAIPALDQNAMLHGYRPASPEDVRAAQLDEKYGGPLQGLASGAEGLASALTFGITPKIETAIGLTTPEDIAGRREAHPISHGIGTGLGIVAPLVLSGGLTAPAEGAAAASALRTAAEYTAPALIARAGEGTAAIARTAQLPGALGRLAPAVATGLTEGALYAGSDVTEKALLGDPALTWEKAASEVGLGALFGGALSGGGKALTDLIPANLGESMADWLGKTAGARNLKAAGAIQTDLRGAMKTRSAEALNEIGQEFGERGLVGPLTTPKDTLARAEELVATGQKEARTLTGAADSLPDSPRYTWNQIREEVAPDLIEKMKSKASTARAAEQFERELDNFSEVYGDKPLGLSDLHALRIDVDKVAGYGVKNMDPALRPVAGPLKRLRSHIDSMIEDGLGEGGDAWREAMRKQEVGLLAKNFAQKGLLRANGNNLVSPTEFLAGLAGVATHGPAGVLAGLGTHLVREHGSGVIGWAATGAQKRLLQLAGRSSRSLEAGVDAIFSGGAGASSAAAAERLTPERYADVSTSLRDYGGNLDRLAEDVSRQTSVLREHAPGVAEAAHAFAARVVSHMGSQLVDEGPRRVLDAPFRPSRSELAEFERHHEIAQRGPVAVLEHMARGTLTPDHVTASAAMYPRLHAHAQQLLADRMAATLAAGKPVPPRVRRGIEMMLGGELQTAVTPAAIASVQRMYASPAGQPASAPRARTRNTETRFSERAAPGSQHRLSAKV